MSPIAAMVDAMSSPITSRPSEVTLAWAAKALGPGARVVRCRRLVGGITSSVHGVTVVDANGGAHALVLKRWVEEARRSPNTMIEREAILLRCVEGSGLPAPSLVAESRPEDTDGYPALLMTRVPGKVNLTPRDPARWLGQMAATLAHIHSLSIDAPISDPSTPTPEFETPAYSNRPGLWEQARRLLAGRRPESTTLIHGDYQHFNLLWARERLTGVIDWTWAGIGHPDRDVGHCRLNLAVLFSPAWADEFAVRYEIESGRRIERWWDVYELSRYSRHWREFIPIQVGRRTPVDLDGMNERVEQLLASALSR
jgi:aminoglycoside phosphotransferase (APT) family kinase protein